MRERKYKLLDNLEERLDSHTEILIAEAYEYLEWGIEDEVDMRYYINTLKELVVIQSLRMEMAKLRKEWT